MNEEEKKVSSKNNATNISIGGAILYISFIIPWMFGVALSKDSIINAVIAFIFPPYAWIITSSWIIDIINKTLNF